MPGVLLPDFRHRFLFPVGTCQCETPSSLLATHTSCLSTGAGLRYIQRFNPVTTELVAPVTSVVTFFASMHVATIMPFPTSGHRIPSEGV